MSNLNDDISKEIDNEINNELSNVSEDGTNIEPVEENGNNSEKKKKFSLKKIKLKKDFTTKQVIIIVVAAVIAVCAIASAVIFAVNDINPVSYIAGEINQGKLVGKWQSREAPGLSAYEFYDDGTYSSYISTFSFDGDYSVQGDRLSLINTVTGQTVVYKYSIVGGTLSLTLIEQNGTQFKDKDATKFDSVTSLNQKSLQDLIDSAKSTTEAADTTTAE
ncbi:MAG: DUF5640 domain-containing protein [Clostridiales bacterium]|nr:DUF5640 domain-containing protein [Clostridiales bacterium]